MLITWFESETSPGTEDQEAEFPPHPGAEASLGDDSKSTCSSFLAKIGLRPPGSRSAFVGKGSHWSVARHPLIWPGLVKGRLVVRGKAEGPSMGRYAPLSSAAGKGGPWGPLPTIHPHLPPEPDPQLDRVTRLAFSWLESGVSDSSCYIGGAGHRPGRSKSLPSPLGLLSSASRQNHSGSFESWTSGPPKVISRPQVGGKRLGGGGGGQT